MLVILLPLLYWPVYRCVATTTSQMLFSNKEINGYFLLKTIYNMYFLDNAQGVIVLAVNVCMETITLPGFFQVCSPVRSVVFCFVLFLTEQEMSTKR